MLLNAYRELDGSMKEPGLVLSSPGCLGLMQLRSVVAFSTKGKKDGVAL